MPFQKNNPELLESTKLAIPQFHVYGYIGSCHTTVSPRYLEGYGLVDGEQIGKFTDHTVAQ